MSGSASFQSAKKSLYAATARPGGVSLRTARGSGLRGIGSRYPEMRQRCGPAVPDDPAAVENFSQLGRSLGTLPGGKIRFAADVGQSRQEPDALAPNATIPNSSGGEATCTAITPKTLSLGRSPNQVYCLAPCHGLLWASRTLALQRKKMCQVKETPCGKLCQSFCSPRRQLPIGDFTRRWVASVIHQLADEGRRSIAVRSSS